MSHLPLPCTRTNTAPTIMFLTVQNSPPSAKSGCFARRIWYSKKFLLRELVTE
jgi:hypothetical protein